MALRVAKVGDITPGGMAAYEVDGNPVAVANVDGQFFAFSNVCTHRGCQLSDGQLDSVNVICPCHGSRFDITTGAVITGPATVAIKTFDLEVVGDDLLVQDLAGNAPGDGPVSAKSILANVPLFSGLGDESLQALEAFTFRRAFKPGEVIVEEGRTGNGLYVILSGRVEVVKGLAQGTPQVIANLGPGEPFGEMALLGEWKRTASVRAVEEAECIGMDRWVFLAYLEREPRIAIRLLQLLAQRLAEMDDRFVE